MSDPAKVAAGLTSTQRHMWNEQERTWPEHLKAGKAGNPFATLCEHCSGRHVPPRDDICPHPDLRGGRAKYALPLPVCGKDYAKAVRAHLLRKE